MAEAALVSVANSVLGQLGSRALKEALFLWNAKKDLKRLEDTTSNIVNILHDAERREPTEERVKGWLSRLRTVLYDIDDFFDVVAWRALHKQTMNGNAFKKEVSLFFSKSNKLILLVKTAHKVKDLRESIGCIYEDIKPFNFQIRPIDESPAGLIYRREETHSFVRVEEVIGRDGEKEEIIKLLVPGQGIREVNEQSLSVISIIGFGGMGKTTLAQLVFNDERVQRGFDMCLWVCINYLSDLKGVLVTILTAVLKSKPRESGLDTLQQNLREKIGEKRFLLVLDDVWDEKPSNWLKLKPLLSCGKSGSKVLVTTRGKKVAECLDAIKPYYQLNVLSEVSARDLFVKMAFEGELSDDDSELILLGKEIVRKCGYVPLVLVTVARMLRYRDKNKKSWMSFVQKELPQVLLDDSSHGNDSIMQVLKFSYNDLPPSLKHCFAYCSLFPKDHLFDKDKLVRMWLAQGFLEPHRQKSLEECVLLPLNR